MNDENNFARVEEPSSSTGSALPHSKTVSHILGEMTWLLTQSPLHRQLKIVDLEWLCMPAIITRQFLIFRESDKPVGLAMWAKCNQEAEAKLDQGLSNAEPKFSLADWQSGDRIWLVDLIAPFADEQNRQREIMMADLISGPLAGKEFRFHKTDETGSRTVQTVPANANQLIKEGFAKASNLQSKPN